MLELPGAEWREQAWTLAEALEAAPQAAAWRAAGQASHAFTHFELRLDVYAATVPAILAKGTLHTVQSMDTAALPTVMRRCIAVVRAAGLA